jgi:RNA polymerase sigma-70 factor (ECF subfamily)
LNSTGSWTADDPAGPLEQRELAESVRRVLARLPSDYALLLTAKYVDGLSMAEIQRQHGGTLEALRSRLARARREFEAMFERVTRSMPEWITTETRRHGE